VGTGDWFVTDQGHRGAQREFFPAAIGNRQPRHRAKERPGDLVERAAWPAPSISRRASRSVSSSRSRLELAVQAIYADLPGKTDPQMNALFNWKNEAKTMGVLFQVFSEKRHERRDGQEFFGYGAIDADSPAAQKRSATGRRAAPLGINSALFEQVRKRQGGGVDLQFKPTKDLMLDVNGFIPN
jgi:iron complex outermembrane receptor protein